MSSRGITWQYKAGAMTEQQRKKRATLNLRLEPTIKKALERAAADDRRTITSLIEMLLIPHLRTNGYLPDDAKPRRAR